MTNSLVDVGRMELDASVVGGVVAGVVGISLGIGASIWAENRVVKRKELKVRGTRAVGGQCHGVWCPQSDCRLVF